MIITTTDPTITKILSGVCLLMPDGSGYAVATVPTSTLRNLCTELNKSKYAGKWSVSFADQSSTGLRYADLLESLDDATEQAFLLSPGYIGADSEDLIYWLEEIYGQPVSMDNYGRVAQLFRFWYSSTHPDEYHDPPDANQAFAGIALYDNAEKRNARTQRREAAMKKRFADRGWDSPSAAMTAMKNGEIEIPWNPKARN